MKKYNVAVVGATGNVGRQMLNILSERNFPVDNIYAIASANSLGMEISYGEEKVLKVESLENFDFSKVDLVLSSPGSKVSEEFVPKAIACGATVIDNSSFFRMKEGVPLIVPEVNSKDLTDSKIISNPNCVVIPLVVALKPLDRASKIKRIILSTYQSVSGNGKLAMDELYSQTKGVFTFKEPEVNVLPDRIAFNLFPHIGNFLEDAYTSEEMKIIYETKKILGEHIKISATCVRVPTFIGHCISVNVEFEKPMNRSLAEQLLSEQEDHIVLISADRDKCYSTPADIAGGDFVYVSRIRDDHEQANTLNMWIGTDNLRKGAALNSVQIAELLYLDNKI